MRFSPFLLLATAIGCQSLPHRAPAEAAQDDTATFQSILAARVGHLDRDVITFHYEGAENSTFRPTNGQDLHQRISGYPELFFDPKETSWNDGPGEYTAIDSLASRSYGRGKPQLFVFVTPKDSVFLDTVTMASADEAATLLRIYTKNNCTYNQFPVANSFTKWFAAFRNNDVIACRQIAITAAKNLGIQLIMHNELGAQTLKDCRHARGYTFDIIASSAVDLDHVAYFDDERTIDPLSLAPFVSALAVEASSDPIIQQLYPIALPATLVNLPVDAAAYSAWKKRAIYACGDPWNGEVSSAPVGARERLAKAYQDPRIVSLATEAWLAFRAKVPRGDWELAHMHQIRKAEYLADNPDQRISFEDWKKAIEGSIFQQDAKAAARLNEPLPKIERIALPEMRDSYWAEHPQESLGEVLRALGYGKQATRVLVNTFYLETGVAPALGDGLEPSSGEFFKILERCRDLYRDPGVSAEAIARGECGFD